MSAAVDDLNPFECFGIPAHVWELPPETPAQERIPGAERRSWVYREIALLGAEAMLGVETLLSLTGAAELSQSSASAESADSPILRQSSSR